MSGHLDMQPGRAMALRKEPKPEDRLRYEEDAREIMVAAIEQMRQRGHDVSAVSVWQGGEMFTVIALKVTQ